MSGFRKSGHILEAHQNYYGYKWSRLMQKTKVIYAFVIIISFIAQKHSHNKILPSYFHNFSAIVLLSDIVIISNIMITTLTIYHDMRYLLSPIPSYTTRCSYKMYTHAYFFIRPQHKTPGIKY